MRSTAFDPENPTAEPARFFDSEAVETLIGNYQRTESIEVLGEIIAACQPLSESLVRSRQSFRFIPETELFSNIDHKLLSAIPAYDSRRGTAFSFISRTVTNAVCTSITLQKKLVRRYQPLDEVLIASTPDTKADFDSTLAVDDLKHQIRSVKSPCTRQSEREAQKWYVESFIDAGFGMRRH